MPASRRAKAVFFLALALALATLVGGALVAWRERESRRGGGSGANIELRWLTRHQSADGSWGSDASAVCSHVECFSPSFPESRIALTSECVLGYLGAGETPSNRATYVDEVNGITYRTGDVVRKAVAFLIARQRDATGEAESTNDLALSALALGEAYGITNAVAYRAPSQTAIDRLLARRRPGGAWTARPDGPEDVLVTGWSIQALKSAEISGLTVDPAVGREALAVLLRPDLRGEGSLGSGVRLLSGIWVQKKKNLAWMPGEAASLAADPPNALFPEYERWHWATMALFQYDAPRGPRWKEWNARASKAILANEKHSGCAAGSWEPDASPALGGRVRATALNLLTLEVYYRYAIVYDGKNHERD